MRLIPVLLAMILIVGFTAAIQPTASMPQQVRPLVNDLRRPPTAEACASCHREICEHFQQTGHARSLWRGDNKEIIARFKDLDFRWKAEGPLFRYVQESDGLWLTRENSNLRLHVDWVMGSGGHSQGPVTLLTNPEGETELWEHLVAWYPNIGLAPALGFDFHQPRDSGMGTLAHWHDHPNAKACLGCHSSYVPLDPHGQVKTDELIGTVGCMRCHPDAGRHVARDGAVDAFRERWSQLSAQDVIDRCGECHRRASETDPGDLGPDVLHIVRFAPVGLSQSRCFKSQGTGGKGSSSVRLDCLTCHDLHRPIPKDTTAVQKVCHSCHYDKQATGQPCRSQPQSSDCVSCHMPLVATDPHFRFTDHWIRVHKK
jgi:hypothetical protein